MGILTGQLSNERQSAETPRRRLTPPEGVDFMGANSRIVYPRYVSENPNNWQAHALKGGAL